MRNMLILLKRHWRRVAIFIGIVAVLLAFVLYFFFVFATAATREAWSWPKLTTDEELRCKQTFKDNSLTPHGSVKFPMFREFSSPLFGESAKTMMYRADLMKDSECFAVRLKSVARHHNPIIVVFYDVETQQSVLVVRNFDRKQIETSTRGKL